MEGMCKGHSGLLERVKYVENVTSENRDIIRQVDKTLWKIFGIVFGFGVITNALIVFIAVVGKVKGWF